MYDFDDRLICRMIIQPRRAVWRDTLYNGWWLAGMFGLIAAVLLGSAAVASLLTNGFVVSQISEGTVNQKVVTLDYWTALYFTLINSTTVGFGDIFPITLAARALAIFNAVFGVLTFASLVSVALMALQPSSPVEGEIDASPLARLQQDASEKLAEATIREDNAQRVCDKVGQGLQEVRIGLKTLLGSDHSQLLSQDLPANVVDSMLRRIEGLIASVEEEQTQSAQRLAIRTQTLMEDYIRRPRSRAAERRKDI